MLLPVPFAPMSTQNGGISFIWTSANARKLLRASCAQPFGFARLSAIPGCEFFRRIDSILMGVLLCLSVVERHTATSHEYAVPRRAMGTVACGWRGAQPRRFDGERGVRATGARASVWGLLGAAAKRPWGLAVGLGELGGNGSTRREVTSSLSAGFWTEPVHCGADLSAADELAWQRRRNRGRCSQ